MSHGAVEARRFAGRPPTKKNDRAVRWERELTMAGKH
jgi:hypothetical protein